MLWLLPDFTSDRSLKLQQNQGVQHHLSHCSPLHAKCRVSLSLSLFVSLPPTLFCLSFSLLVTLSVWLSFYPGILPLSCPLSVFLSFFLHSSFVSTLSILSIFVPACHAFCPSFFLYCCIHLLSTFSIFYPSPAVPGQTRPYQARLGCARSG